jgi:hypothetical protein
LWWFGAAYLLPQRAGGAPPLCGGYAATAMMACRKKCVRYCPSA